MVCLDSSAIIDILRKRLDLEQLKIKCGKDEIIKIPSPAIIKVIRGLYLDQNIPNVRENEKDKINKLFSSFPILNFDKNCAIEIGEMKADLINMGEKIDIEDIMIGVIAKQNGEKLITRNVKHFERIKELEVEGY